LNNQVASTAANVNTFPDEWTWSNSTAAGPVATLNIVNAGVNMINFWVREDGMAFDKFIITNDPDFIPTGFGPDATDGTSNFVAPGVEVVDSEGSDDASGESDGVDEVSDESEEDSSSRSGGGGGSTSLMALLALVGLAMLRVRRTRLLGDFSI